MTDYTNNSFYCNITTTSTSTTTLTNLITTTNSLVVITFYNNSTFIYNPEYLNNQDASTWCATYGATLINIHNKEDLNFALSMIQNNDSFWVNFLGKQKIFKNFIFNRKRLVVLLLKCFNMYYLMVLYLITVYFV